MITEIVPGCLWTGTIADIPRARSTFGREGFVVVHLTFDGPAPELDGLPYCRVPLLSQGGNPKQQLRIAVDVTAALLRSGTRRL